MTRIGHNIIIIGGGGLNIGPALDTRMKEWPPTVHGTATQLLQVNCTVLYFPAQRGAVSVQRNLNFLDRNTLL